jgi:hypothetical protein
VEFSIRVHSLRLLTGMIGGVLLLAGMTHGQTAGPTRVERKAIAHAKRTLVSEIEPGMPTFTLEYFLRSEAGPDAAINWEANDCGEQTGNPEVDRNRDIPVCAQADVTLPDGRVLTVMIAVGSVKTGIRGKPALFSASITNGAVPGASTKPIARLSRIPAELHPLASPKPRTRDVSPHPSTPGA